MPDTAPPYARLTPAFADFLRAPSKGFGSTKWPTRKTFTSRFRRSNEGSAERAYAAMKGGGTVPWQYVQLLVEWAEEKHNWIGGIQGAAEMIDASEVMDIGTAWDAWMDAESALGSVERRGCLEFPEMLCPAEGVPRAVQIIMRCVGRKVAPPGMKPDEARQLTIAEELMGRTLGQFTAWFQAMHAREPRILMYPVCKQRPRTAKWEPVGVSSIVPLTDAAGQDILAGRRSDIELTPDDIQVPARHVLIHAMGEYPHHMGYTYDKVTHGQIHCVFVQLGYSTYPRTESLYPPVLIGFGGNPHYEKRLRRLTFQDCGVNLAGTPVPLMKYHSPYEWCAQPDDPTVTDYFRVRTAIHKCHVANAATWDRR